MKKNSEYIIKSILRESLEAELSAVPSDEQLRRQHTFSREFEEKMKPVLESQKGSAGGKTIAAGRSLKKNKSGGNKQRSVRILAACIACFLVLGAAFGVGRLLFSPKGGMGSASPESSGMAEGSSQCQDSAFGDGGSAEEGSGGNTADQAAEETDLAETVWMVRLDGKLYTDTGEISGASRCGTADFTLDSTVEQGVPTENGQTNFGAGYDGQWGMRENRIEVCVDGSWHIFAWQENDLEDVSLTVSSAAALSAEIQIENQSEQDLSYGESYSLEVFEEETATWMPLMERGEISWHDLAYEVSAGTSSSQTVDWTDRYGQLSPGTYRIVKQIYVGQGDAETAGHTLMAEFSVTA